MFALHFILPAVVFLLVLVVARIVWPQASIAQTPYGRWLGVLILAAISGFLSWGALRLAELFLSIRFLAGGPEENSIAENSVWASLAYFAAMVVGMIAQTSWHAIQVRKANQAPTFDKWEFVKPALVAPIVFIAVYHNITQAGITVVMLLFSFQNGFFWQTVLRHQKS